MSRTRRGERDVAFECMRDLDQGNVAGGATVGGGGEDDGVDARVSIRRRARVEFLAGIRRLATAHDILLIADEVLTGFGRTGGCLPAGRAGVFPDIMCVAKGLTGGFLPLAATLTTDHVHDAFTGPTARALSFHGHSYTANPIACAAATPIFTFSTPSRFLSALQQSNKYTPRASPSSRRILVADVRHIGSVAAIELKVPDAGYLSSLRPRLYEFYLNRGVLSGLSETLFYILPPYVITPAKLDFVYDIIGDSLALLSS